MIDALGIERHADVPELRELVTVRKPAGDEAIGIDDVQEQQHDEQGIRNNFV